MKKIIIILALILSPVHGDPFGITNSLLATRTMAMLAELQSLHALAEEKIRGIKGMHNSLQSIEDALSTQSLPSFLLNVYTQTPACHIKPAGQGYGSAVIEPIDSMLQSLPDFKKWVSWNQLCKMTDVSANSYTKKDRELYKKMLQKAMPTVYGVAKGQKANLNTIMESNKLVNKKIFKLQEAIAYYTNILEKEIESFKYQDIKSISESLKNSYQLQVSQLAMQNKEARIKHISMLIQAYGVQLEAIK